MSTASEQAARAWRETGDPGISRWCVYRSGRYGPRAWTVLPPLGAGYDCHYSDTHAEAIAWADKQARERTDS